MLLCECMMQGMEPGLRACEASALPLSHTRSPVPIIHWYTGFNANFGKFKVDLFQAGGPEC